MTLAVLKSMKEFPRGLSPLLQAMWHDLDGNWEASHTIVQGINTRHGSWVHAYLHRKEGDRSNATYWYHQAGKKMPTFTLEEEQEEIVRALPEND